MKAKRNKQVKKILGFYENNFGFRKPYQILVDGTFCFAALQNKIHIADNLPRYLQGELLLVTTACAIMEMEKFGSKVVGASLILKQFGLHKCGHEKKAISGAECLLSMLGDNNDKHYILATQDRDLEDKVRMIPGAALLYLHSRTPVLDKPSMASISLAKEKMSGLGQFEKLQLEKLLKEQGNDDAVKKPRKKKIKGPNPKSCLKKKKKPNQGPPQKSKKSEPTEEQKKEKKKKIRYSKHIKEEMKKGNIALLKGASE